jgi:uncharacterized protein YndB with AHSA1/START domain
VRWDWSGAGRRGAAGCIAWSPRVFGRCTSGWPSTSRRELPNDLDVLITREFDAPIALVFDVLTKPEHVSKWFAPHGCKMKECSIDLRVGGNYHQVFVTDDGTECSFRGTYLEIEPPTRTVETWVFEGRPHLDTVETVELHEADQTEDLLRSLLDQV